MEYGLSAFVGVRRVWTEAPKAVKRRSVAGSRVGGRLALEDVPAASRSPALQEKFLEVQRQQAAEKKPASSASKQERDSLVSDYEREAALYQEEGEGSLDAELRKAGDDKLADQMASPEMNDLVKRETKLLNILSALTTPQICRKAWRRTKSGRSK